MKIIQSPTIISNKRESEERKSQERERERDSKSEEYIETVYISTLNNKESDSRECIGSTPRLALNNEERGDASSNEDGHEENDFLILIFQLKD